MAEPVRWIDDPDDVLDKTHLVERFVNLVRIDSPSDPNCSDCPSTSLQFNVADYVVGELKALGLHDATRDPNCYVYATLPGRVEGPTIGLVAHMDTSPAFSGHRVKPILHQNYDGSAIRLNNDVVIDPEDSPELKQCLGDTVITADGTTLLGADDKAGIAEILAALEYLQLSPETPHPTLRIAFTPDEEIGRGADLFDLDGFGATVAYTIDGGFIGDVSTETFSADQAFVTISGVSVHPGTAKGKMVNAMNWAARFLDHLPQKESPQETEGKEGFFHPTDISGGAAKVTIKLILRDFDDAILADRGERLQAIVGQLRKEEPRLKIDLQLKNQYRNMANWLREAPAAAEMAFAAIKRTGLEVDNQPIRGGTDGSRLTEKGLPTPNLFTGGVNYHGPQEWISTRAMALATCTIVNLVQSWARQPNP